MRRQGFNTGFRPGQRVIVEDERRAVLDAWDEYRDSRPLGHSYGDGPDVDFGVSGTMKVLNIKPARVKGDDEDDPRVLLALVRPLTGMREEA